MVEMSHAANLRNYQRKSATPAKRRKLSSDSSKQKPHVNGVAGLFSHDPDAKLTATPVQDAKVSKGSLHERFDVKVAHANDDDDIHDAPNGTVISSDSDSASSDDVNQAADKQETDVEEEDASDEEQTGEQSKLHKNNVEKEPRLEEPAQEETEPTFGELLQARNEQPVNISIAPAVDYEPHDPSNKSSGGPSPAQNALSVPNAASLGSVLSQALRTNDTSLLESCFQVSSLPSIRATIERLPSPQASALLQKLAERMHKRPGRAGTLMIWVQWTIVAHGGYLASQPGAMRSLQTLYRVVTERASALQPLLALKGKLDLLEAQMQLRKNRTAGNQRSKEGVIYVEGEEDSSDDSDNQDDDDQDVGHDEAILGASCSQKARKGRGKRPEVPVSGDMSGSADEEEPLVNGVDASSDEDMEDEASDEEEDAEEDASDEALALSDDEEDEMSDDESNNDEEMFDVEAEEGEEED